MIKSNGMDISMLIFCLQLGGGRSWSLFFNTMGFQLPRRPTRTARRDTQAPAAFRSGLGPAGRHCRPLAVSSA